MNRELSQNTKGLKSAIFTKIDRIFGAAMLVCGFLYWNFINSNELGSGVTVFAVILCGVVGIYLYRNGIKQTKESMECLLIVGLSALQFFLFDLTPVSFFNFIFLSLAVVYWICSSTGRRLDSKLSIYFFGDITNQLFIIPFCNFLCCFASLRPAKRDGHLGRTVLSAFIGVVIFLPVLVLVVNLLIRADAAFESLLSNFHFSLSVDMVEYLIQMILGIPVACYLYGSVYGSLKMRHATTCITMGVMNAKASALQFAPRTPVFSALTVLNGIYLLFFFAQGSYLFSAFASHLPETMTYAQYARRGFFELCGVAAINLLVIGVAYMITRRGGQQGGNPAESGEFKHAEVVWKSQEITKGLKIEILALCSFTVLLIGTALSKMGLYIHYYGLTQLRVYTTWFMVLLLFIFIIVGLRQFFRFNGSKIVIIGFIIFFLVLAYGNVDGIIAKYNIGRYREGTLQSVDTEAFMSLSDAATPYIVSLYHETDNPTLKRQLKFAIDEKYNAGGHIEDGVAAVRSLRSDWRCFNLQNHRAAQLEATL